MTFDPKNRQHKAQLYRVLRAIADLKPVSYSPFIGQVLA